MVKANWVADNATKFASYTVIFEAIEKSLPANPRVPCGLAEYIEQN